MIASKTVAANTDITDDTDQTPVRFEAVWKN